MLLILFSKKRKMRLVIQKNLKYESTKFYPFRKFSCLDWERHALKYHLILEKLCHIHIIGRVRFGL